MNKIRAPKTRRAERPADVMRRLEGEWERLLAAELTGSSSFPLEVRIAQPPLDAESLAQDAAAIIEWREDWKSCAVGQVVWESLSRRRFNRFEVPSALSYASIDDLAGALGAGRRAELARARERMSALCHVDDRLALMGRRWSALDDMPADEFRGLLSFISKHREMSPEELASMDARELAVPGFDSKSIERRRRIVRDALVIIEQARPGKSIREVAGFRIDNRMSMWVKVHPADLAGPFGAQQFAVRPDETLVLPGSITRAVIVENISPFFSFEPVAGTLLIWGSGNEMAGMAPRLTCLRHLEIHYWGDLDSYGMKILSRVRQALPQTASVLMDPETMHSHRHLWTPEAGERSFPGPIDGLHPHELATLAFIRAGDNRLEQERIAGAAQALAPMGLVPALPIRTQDRVSA